jgi:hypothetical protein
MLLGQSANLPLSFANGSEAGNRDAQRAWHLDYLLVQDWNDTEFVNSDKTIILYDPTHETAPQHINNYFWNNTVWTQNGNFNYLYDEDSGLIYKAEHNGFSSGNPSPSYEYYFTYDNADHLTGINTYQYQPNAENWVAYKRLHFVYTEGYLTSTVEWKYNFGNTAYERYDYTYGTDHKVATKTRLNCTDSLSWVTTNRDAYTYHPNDYTTNDGFLNFFTYTYPITYPLQQTDIPSFSTYGMPAQITSSYYIGGNWMVMSRGTYSYNIANRPTEFLEEVNGGTWMNDQRWTMTYDTNGNPEYQTFQDWESDAWVNQNRIAYFWAQTTANEDQTTPALTDINLKVYPCPFQNTLQVNTTSKQTKPVTLQLFNTKGQCVQKLTAQPNQQISLDGKTLPNGIYLLKATQGTSTETHKVIKIK